MIAWFQMLDWVAVSILIGIVFVILGTVFVIWDTLRSERRHRNRFVRPQRLGPPSPRCQRGPERSGGDW